MGVFAKSKGKDVAVLKRQLSELEARRQNDRARCEALEREIKAFGGDSSVALAVLEDPEGAESAAAAAVDGLSAKRREADSLREMLKAQSVASKRLAGEIGLLECRKLAASKGALVARIEEAQAELGKAKMALAEAQHAYGTQWAAGFAFYSGALEGRDDPGRADFEALPRSL